MQILLLRQPVGSADYVSGSLEKMQSAEIILVEQRDGSFVCIKNRYGREDDALVDKR